MWIRSGGGNTIWRGRKTRSNGEVTLRVIVVTHLLLHIAAKALGWVHLRGKGSITGTQLVPEEGDAAKDARARHCCRERVVGAKEDSVCCEDKL